MQTSHMHNALKLKERMARCCSIVFSDGNKRKTERNEWRDGEKINISHQMIYNLFRVSKYNI